MLTDRKECENNAKRTFFLEFAPMRNKSWIESVGYRTSTHSRKKRVTAVEQEKENAFGLRLRVRKRVNEDL